MVPWPNPNPNGMSPLNTKSALLDFIRMWDLVLICWKCGHQSLKTTEIGIRTPLKSENYFRFVSRTIGDEATTFRSRVQNLVKIGKDCGRNRSTTYLFTDTETDRREKNWLLVYPMHWIGNNIMCVQSAKVTGLAYSVCVLYEPLSVGVCLCCCGATL